MDLFVFHLLIRSFYFNLRGYQMKKVFLFIVMVCITTPQAFAALSSVEAPPTTSKKNAPLRHTLHNGDVILLKKPSSTNNCAPCSTPLQYSDVAIVYDANKGYVLSADDSQIVPNLSPPEGQDPNLCQGVGIRSLSAILESGQYSRARLLQHKNNGTTSRPEEIMQKIYDKYWKTSFESHVLDIIEAGADDCGCLSRKTEGCHLCSGGKDFLSYFCVTYLKKLAKVMDARSYDDLLTPNLTADDFLEMEDLFELKDTILLFVKKPLSLGQKLAAFFACNSPQASAKAV